MYLKNLSSNYSFGDEISAADVFLYPQLDIAQARYNVDLSKLPKL